MPDAQGDRDESREAYVSPSAYIGPARPAFDLTRAPVTSTTTPNQEGGGGSSGTGGPGEMVVLTPSRLRLDSRILAVHCTSQWLSNGIFAILLYFKVGMLQHLVALCFA